MKTITASVWVVLFVSVSFQKHQFHEVFLYLHLISIYTHGSFVSWGVLFLQLTLFVHFKLTLVCFPRVAQLSIKLWCRLNKLNGSSRKGSKLWSGAVHWWWCESNADGPQDYVRVAVGFQTEFKRPTTSKRSARPGSVTRPSPDL